MTVHVRRLLVAYLLLVLAACGPQPARPVAQQITATSAVTATATATSTATATATTTTTTIATATATNRPTRTPRPTATPTSTRTPRPTATPSPTPDLFSPYAPPDPAQPTPAIPYPTAVPAWERPAGQLNLLLLGNDNAGSQGRTDAIIVAAVNLRDNTATLLSIPRDLYVYIPGWTIQRINTAVPHGGVPLLKETLRYNLGLEIDHYARVGFDGFKQIIDALDGVPVAVTCPLEDWRLKEPGLDPTVEENWVRFKLEVNVYTMDGDLALWYARSRYSTSDFDRGRRQQQIIGAMIERAVSRNALADVPGLVQAFAGAVETDIPLPTLVRLAAAAPAIRNAGVRHLALDSSTVDDLRVGEDRLWVQVLDWAAAAPRLEALNSPAALGRGARAALTVEVVTSSWVDYRLAAENLAWFGFAPQWGQPGEGYVIPEGTTLTFYGDSLRGSYDRLVSYIFHDRPVQLAAAGSAATNYRIVLGSDFNPCRSVLGAP